MVINCLFFSYFVPLLLFCFAFSDIDVEPYFYSLSFSLSLSLSLSQYTSDIAFSVLPMQFTSFTFHVSCTDLQNAAVTVTQTLF
jgi:hypothetical protein